MGAMHSKLALRKKRLNLIKEKEFVKFDLRKSSGRYGKE
jgi:hypothetical protein